MSRGAWKALGFLGIVSLSLFFAFYGINSLPLIDPDEGRHADIARGMVESGDWVTPRFNGIRHFEKPPLIYWLIASAYSIFGTSEWATRLWLGIAGTGVVILTILVGRIVYGWRVGLLAGFILTTNIGYLFFTTLVRTDLLFTFFTSLAFFAFLLVRHQPEEARGPLLLFYLSIGLAVLTKGLIGAIFPALVVGSFMALTRDLPIKKLGLRWGLPLLLAIVLPWHLLAASRNHGFWWYYIIDHHVLRFFNQRMTIEDTSPLPVFVFLLATLFLFFPWGLFLPGALLQPLPKWRQRAEDPEKGHLLILLWAGVILLFFSLASSRLEHYALSAFPAFSLLVGRLWQDLADRVPSAMTVILTPLVLFLLLSILFLVGAFGPPEQLARALFSLDVHYRVLQEQGLPLPPFHHALPILKWIILGFTFGSVVALFLSLLRLPLMAFGAFGVGTIFALALIAKGALILAPHWSVKPLAGFIQQRVREGAILVHEGPLENSASLPFYTGRQVLILDGRRGQLSFGAGFPEAHGIFLEGKDLPQLWQGKRQVFFVTPLPVSRSALRFLNPAEVHLLAHQGGRWLFSNQEDEAQKVTQPTKEVLGLQGFSP